MMQTSELGAASFAEPLFDWKPDAERLEREVRSAELKGRRDELTLAEIECSLDLIDAELSGLRRKPANTGPDRKAKELTAIRGRLSALASRLYRLPE
ncbi:MAG TPA: hypothetical protein VGD86_09585 [Devosia sp.]